MGERVEIVKSILTKYGYINRCSFFKDVPTEDKVCLDYDNHTWTVFYEERGHKFDEAFFSTENEACVHMLLKGILDKKIREKAVKEYYLSLLESPNVEIRTSTANLLISTEVERIIA